MFDIGWSELLVIAVVALIVIGPKELPEVMRNLGKALNKMRRTADDFRRQFEESVKDTTVEDLQRELQKNLREFYMNHPAKQFRDSIEKALNEDGKPRVQGPVEYKPTDAELAAGGLRVPELPQAAPAEIQPEPAANNPPPVGEAAPAPQPAIFHVSDASQPAIKPLTNGHAGEAVRNAASASPDKAS